MRILFILPPWLGIAVGCQSSTGESETKDFRLAEVEKHIHEMNKNYGERFRHGDAEFYKERYCRDIIIMPEQLPPISGIDSVRIFNYNEGRNQQLNIVVTATKIYGGPEVVVEEGHFDYPDEKEAGPAGGKFIAIWKREQGIWKLYREIWNGNGDQ